jgi:hypothetical protein
MTVMVANCFMRGAANQRRAGKATFSYAHVQCACLPRPFES